MKKKQQFVSTYNAVETAIDLSKTNPEREWKELLSDNLARVKRWKGEATIKENPSSACTPPSQQG
jgi:hypothetical protein